MELWGIGRRRNRKGEMGSKEEKGHSHTHTCDVGILACMTCPGKMIEYQPYMMLFFLGFIIFTTFGIMNVIIGVIVDNTMVAARKVEEVTRKAKKKKS